MNGLNRKGMLGYGRDYKLPFYALQEVYTKEEAVKAECRLLLQYTALGYRSFTGMYHFFAKKRRFLRRGGK